MENEPILVSIESPLSAKTKEEVLENIKYARACMKDCLDRNEYPYASHLLYAQEGILDDTILTERALGMMAGKAWEIHAKKTVVYTDRGISSGMEWGIAKAREAGRTIEYRKLKEK
jgi:hypothetical protein